jgi:phospholipid N-methyltransferase
MSLLFFKRVLANPIRVGYLVPSSPFLTRKTAGCIDFSKPRTVVELGPGEGCHTRQIVRRMNPESRLILVELDAHFVGHLETQFESDSRVTVIHGDALHLPEILAKQDCADPDYIVSGIPFTIMERGLREQLIASIARAMGPESVFITYQFSLQLAEHELFEMKQRDHCLFNLPPLNVLQLTKAMPNGAAS